MSLLPGGLHSPLAQGLALLPLCSLSRQAGHPSTQHRQLTFSERSCGRPWGLDLPLPSPQLPFDPGCPTDRMLLTPSTLVPWGQKELTPTLEEEVTLPQCHLPPASCLPAMLRMGGACG